MILVEAVKMDTVDDVKRALQRAVQLEFATIPPYLYAWFTVGDNAPARTRISDVFHEEMVHMMLVCNVLNALDGKPLIADASVVPTYPGPLPFAIGSDDGDPFDVHLYAFSEQAMAQAAKIEEPEEPLDIPSAEFALAEPEFHTIGEFYAALKAALPPDGPGWNPVNQIDDSTAFAGELFAVNGLADAQKAIDHIVSQGEGTSQGTTGTPLDFEGEISHYYRFTEIQKNQVLQKAPHVEIGYQWGPPLGIDFAKATKAINNPGEYDFSADPPAQAAQDQCDLAFSEMLVELQRAVSGEPARLGHAVRKMFDLSQAAYAAIATPLAGKPGFVAGPAFCFRPDLIPATQG